MVMMLDCRYNCILALSLSGPLPPLSLLMPPDTLVKCAKVRNVLVVLISSHLRQSFVFVSPLPLACASSSYACASSWVCTSSTWACTSLSSIYTSSTSACACQETTRLLCLLTTSRQEASSIYAKSCQTTCCYIDYTNGTRGRGTGRDEEVATVRKTFLM